MPFRGKKTTREITRKLIRRAELKNKDEKRKISIL